MLHVDGIFTCISRLNIGKVEGWNVRGRLSGGRARRQGSLRYSRLGSLRYSAAHGDFTTVNTARMLLMETGPSEVRCCT
jgi:hypothetical protein